MHTGSLFMNIYLLKYVKIMGYYHLSELLVLIFHMTINQMYQSSVTLFYDYQKLMDIHQHNIFLIYFIYCKKYKNLGCQRQSTRNQLIFNIEIINIVSLKYFKSSSMGSQISSEQLSAEQRLEQAFGLIKQGSFQKIHKLITNIHQKQVILTNKHIGSNQCLYFTQIYWFNLQEIYLGNNNIGEEGCSYLNKVNWPNLRTIQLGSNNIGNQGCSHLSKTNWPNLRTIQLGSNQIQNEGCSYLRKADWPRLQGIYLDSNIISIQGCSNLSKTRWIKLQRIWLGWNNIGDEGCSHLRKTYWPNLQTIQLPQQNWKFRIVVSLKVTMAKAEINMAKLKRNKSTLDKINGKSLPEGKDIQLRAKT